jgi:mannonate dehydratase
MYKIMKALRDVDYDGIVIPDHVPRMGARDAPAGGRAANQADFRSGLAYSVAYMRALRDRAIREAKA